MCEEKIVKVLCPRCKGRSHVTDFVGIGCLTIVGPFIALLEKDDDPRYQFSATRKVCPNCNGNGYIRF